MYIEYHTVDEVLAFIRARKAILKKDELTRDMDRTIATKELISVKLQLERMLRERTE